MESTVGRLGSRTIRRINLGLLTVAVLMLLTAGVGALGTVRLFSGEVEVYRSNETISGLERLLSLACDAETGQRGYVITGRPEYLEPFLAASPKISQEFQHLALLIQGDAAQQQRLAELRSLLDRKQAELVSVIAVRRTQGFTAAQEIVQDDTGKVLMDQARTIVTSMELAAQNQLDGRRDSARKTRDLGVAIGLTSGALTLGVCLSFGYLMRRLLWVEASAAESLSEQKELLHVTLSSIGEGVVATDASGGITFVSPVAQKLTGWPDDEAIGQPVGEVLTFLDVAAREQIENPALVALRERRIVGGGAGQTLLAGRHGVETPVDGSGAPIFDGTGKLVGSVLVFRDITERMRLEERFRATVESAPTAIVMVNRAGRITLVNALTETLFGYLRDELLDQPVEILLPERYRATHPGLRDGFSRVPSARRMGDGRDLYARRKDGSEFPVEIGLNPIETSEGVFVLGAIADITERKRVEEDLRGRTEQLARSNQDLEQFAYVASHDLQEPLRAVTGPLQLLQRRYQGQLDARADEFIGHAVDGATRMQALIDDLLVYSRVGRPEDSRQPTDCAEVLNQALRNLSTAIHESGAQVSRDTLPTVQAIPTQLTLLFQNLVANAIKFRHKDRPVQIHVGAERRSGAWLLSVRDNGIGIDPQYFERIFLIFQRLHTRREYPGTGIGLALCKRIVEQHGGCIWVESGPEQGTTFFFTLHGGVRDGARSCPNPKV